MWNKFRHLDEIELWEQIWNLQAFEKYIYAAPAVEKGDKSEADMLSYDRYGIDLDMLCHATYNSVHDFAKHVDEVDIPKQALRILKYLDRM